MTDDNDLTGQHYSNDTVSQPVLMDVQSIAVVDGQLSVCGRFQFPPVVKGSVEPPKGFTFAPHDDDATLYLLVGTGAATLFMEQQIVYRTDYEKAAREQQEARDADKQPDR